MIYSLRTVNDGTVLSIDLIGHIISETHLSIQFSLPTGITIISKFDYLNKGKIYDDGKVFFLVCNKQYDRDQAFAILIQYAIEKYTKYMNGLDQPERKELWKGRINRWKTEMVAA